MSLEQSRNFWRNFSKSSVFNISVQSAKAPTRQNTDVSDTSSLVSAKDGLMGSVTPDLDITESNLIADSRYKT